MQNGARRFLGTIGGLTALLGVYTFVIRPWHLRWGLTDAEFRKSYPGDSLLPDVNGHVTHAITIQGTPEQIWPWLMQIGQDRGGFYSYTPLENLFGCEMPKVEELVPNWPDRDVDEKVWFATPRHFGGKAYMNVAIAERNSVFVLAATSDLAARQAATWGFFLEPAGPHTTRLIVRVRAGDAPGIMGKALAYLFWEPAHFVMERKMLLTIKSLAERTTITARAESLAAH